MNIENLLNSDNITLGFVVVLAGVEVAKMIASFVDKKLEKDKEDGIVNERQETLKLYLVQIEKLRSYMDDTKTDLKAFTTAQTKQDTYNKIVFTDLTTAMEASIDHLSQSVMNDRSMSDSMFKLLVTEIINGNVHKTLYEIAILFISNGFENEFDLGMLKENAKEISKRNKNKIRLQVAGFNDYSSRKLGEYQAQANVILIEYETLIDAVIDHMTLEDLKRCKDKHYSMLIKMVENQVKAFRDNLLEIVEGVVDEH